MRGSPPFQLALLLLGFFVLGVPLVQLTSGRPVPMTPRPAASAEASRPVLIRVRYVNLPQTLSVKLGGKVRCSVFKTAAIDRSATSPWRNVRTIACALRFLGVIVAPRGGGLSAASGVFGVVRGRTAAPICSGACGPPGKD